MFLLLDLYFLLCTWDLRVQRAQIFILPTNQLTMDLTFDISQAVTCSFTATKSKEWTLLGTF